MNEVIMIPEIPVITKSAEGARELRRQTNNTTIIVIVIVIAGQVLISTTDYHNYQIILNILN